MKVKIIKPCSLGKEGEVIEVSKDVFELYKNYVKEVKDYKNKMMKKTGKVKTK